MGVGTPSDILGAVNEIDMFDCVMPTRSEAGLLLPGEK